jgi:hypothetical protein
MRGARIARIVTTVAPEANEAVVSPDSKVPDGLILDSSSRGMHVSVSVQRRE